MLLGTSPPKRNTAVAVASAISMKAVFTVRRTSDWSQNRRDGKCTVRVRIDDDSDAIGSAFARCGAAQDATKAASVTPLYPLPAIFASAKTKGAARLA